jgi:EAL domain-containing protein (putative c-di-GMP-specific phosphodiesterase class I)/ActR/RegA family two-component response regulator
MNFLGHCNCAPEQSRKEHYDNVIDMKILLLDDETFMLKLISRVLTNLGYSEVSSFDSGLAALESFESPNSPPDLVLMDLNMPEMDGIEFIRHLVERRYTGSLILISGEDERMLLTAEKLVRTHQITVLGHLHKPIKPEALSALLEHWGPHLQYASHASKRVYEAGAVRAAIHSGELVNYYQPKVMVSTGRVVGVETLVRWRHPEDGMVFPDQFIGVAETNGLIDDLTRVVLTDALAQIRLWEDAGMVFQVAVNVSMDNLKALDFPDFVAGLAANAGVSPQRVILEVTESRLMEDLRVALEILMRLRLKRFRLSIDDFGTGHSSMSQLRDIPFDELKIDQGFVHGAYSNERVRAIYNASLSLARQLGMEIVAEGVEDRDDWNFLCQTGCERAQGYFIAKAMPAADLPAWMEAWQERVSGELADKH